MSFLVKSTSSPRSASHPASGDLVSPGRPGAAHPTVLIADGDRSARHALAATLRREHYVVVEATSGVEMIEVAESRQPNLILLDIRMPDTDGIDAVTELKANTATAHIPVIAVSPVALRAEARRCLEAGAVDCLTKPLDPLDVIEALARHLPRLAGEQHVSY